MHNARCDARCKMHNCHGSQLAVHRWSMPTPVRTLCIGHRALQSRPYPPPSLPFSFLISRRSRFVGVRGAGFIARKIRSRRRASISSRDGAGVRSSYRSRASVFGIERSARPLTMTVCWRPSGREMMISSPDRKRRCGLPDWPLTSTLPASHARFASERVRNRHATSSHTSRRTPSAEGFSSALTGVEGGNQTIRLRAKG